MKPLAQACPTRERSPQLAAATRALNDGRSLRKIAAALAFENQSYRASGLNLVIAAIVYWNTV